MGVPYSIFCCFKSTTETRLIDLEAGGGGGGTYSTDVNTMLASANNAAIRSAIGVGTTDAPTFLKTTAYDATSSALSLNGFQLSAAAYTGKHGLFSKYGSSSEGWTLMSGGTSQISGTVNWPGPWVTQHLGFAPSSTAIPTTFLWEDGASNTLALRNTTSRQAFRVYNTYTSALIYERAVMGWNATTGNLDIGTEFLGGSGMAAKQIDFVTGGAVRMSVTPTGFVGIGTASPIALLDVRGANTVTSAVNIGGTAANVGNFVTLHGNATNGGAVRIFSNYNTTDGALLLGTYNSQNTLCLATSGNVGIGTTAPASGLHVSGALGGNVTTYDSAAAIKLTNTTGNSSWLLTSGIIGVINASFSIRQEGTSIPALTINNVGNVGIGVISTLAKVDTADTWNFSPVSITAASGNGTTATITVLSQSGIVAGSTIVIAGVTPAGFNGTFIATAATGTSITYANATTGAGTGGTIDRVFTSVKLNVTDTASNAASNLMDLQKGGVSQFSVTKAGVLVLNDVSAIRAVPSSGWIEIGAKANVLAGATSRIAMWETGLGLVQLANNGSFAWSELAHAANGSGDLALYRDAKGILAQRNASAAQAFRVYNTLPAGSPTAGEWLEIDWQTAPLNTVKIGTNKGVAGTRRALNLCIDGNAVFGLSKDSSSSGAWWSIATSGNLLCDVNNTYDIGASTGNRPKNIYAGTALISGGSVQVGSGGNQLIFGGRGSISPSADGVWTFYNSASNDFGRLCLGNTTSAFPAIKRVGADINIVLADDSGLAGLSCGLFNAAGIVNAAGSRTLWSGRSALSSPSDGVVRVTNNGSSGFTSLELGEADMGIMRGTGTPEGVVTGKIGSIFLRLDGGASTTLYVKQSSPTPNTGWVAK